MYILIAISTLLASIVTFYSGFGLGTILMPVLAIFFPLPLAIILTAVVHLFHNLLKSILLYKFIHWKVALKFGAIALVAAIPGALLLKKLSFLPGIQEYSIWGFTSQITLLKIIIGCMLLLIASAEFFKKRILPFHNLFISGTVSGFLGGLSGHQGAFRSIFLVHIEKDKNRFIATSSIISVAIDAVRLIIYLYAFTYYFKKDNLPLLTTSLGAALVGVIVGICLLPQITIGIIRNCIIFLLSLFGLLMILGVI